MICICSCGLGLCYLLELCNSVVSTGLPIPMETEKLRCEAVAFEHRKSNYQFVNIKFLFEDFDEMIKIPSTVNEGDVLCCSNITKLCMWKPCPVIPKKPVIPTQPKITHFKIIFFCRNTVNISVDMQELQHWIYTVAQIVDTITHVCVKETTIKLTIDVIDVNYIKFNSNLGNIVDKVSVCVCLYCIHVYGAEVHSVMESASMIYQLCLQVAAVNLSYVIISVKTQLFTRSPNFSALFAVSKEWITRISVSSS